MQGAGCRSFLGAWNRRSTGLAIANRNAFFISPALYPITIGDFTNTTSHFRIDDTQRTVFVNRITTHPDLDSHLYGAHYPIPSPACYSTPDILEYHFNTGRNSGTVLLEALEIGFDQIKRLPCPRHISSSSALHSTSCSCSCRD
jgi:hypothetical protein